jgi:hypothetical protein
MAVTMVTPGSRKRGKLLPDIILALLQLQNPAYF